MSSNTTSTTRSIIRRVNATENLAVSAKDKADTTAHKEQKDRQEIQKLKSELGRIKKDANNQSTVSSRNRQTRNTVRNYDPNLQPRLSNAVVPYTGPARGGHRIQQLPMYTVSDPKDVSIFYNRPKTGITEGKYWNEAQNANDMWSAWDKFTINRFSPAASLSPYVNNMTITPVPTGTFRNSFSIAQCYNITNGSQAPVGTLPYTVIMYLPSLSAFGGTTSGGSFFGSSQRPGGFMVTQTSSLSTSYDCRYFLESNYSYSSIQLYGSDFTSFASGGMVWAGSMDLRIVCPAANLTGAVYKGCLTWNQLGASPTLGNLIQNAQYTSTGDYESTLRSSVVEPALIEDIYAAPAITNNGAQFTGMDNEVISYLVYQTPVQSITSGSTAFTLIANQRGNFAYYPKVTDPLAFSLGPTWSKPMASASVDPSRRHPLVSSLLLPKMNSPVADSKDWKETSTLASTMLDDTLDLSIIPPGNNSTSFLTSRSDPRSRFSHENNTTVGFDGPKRSWKDDASDVSELLGDVSTLASVAPGPIGAVARVVSSIAPSVSRFFRKLAGNDSHNNSANTSMFTTHSNMLESRLHKDNASSLTTVPVIAKADLSYHWRELSLSLDRIRVLDYSSGYVSQFTAWTESFRTWLSDQPDYIPISAIGPPIPVNEDQVSELIVKE